MSSASGYDQSLGRLPSPGFGDSLRSRRLGLVALGSSWHKKKRAREKETSVSLSRAPVLSFAHYFQAPATQATSVMAKMGRMLTDQAIGQMLTGIA